MDPPNPPEAPASGRLVPAQPAPHQGELHQQVQPENRTPGQRVKDPDPEPETFQVAAFPDWFRGEMPFCGERLGAVSCWD